ncbi:cytochrome c maturation protein CcmE domain-containing protein [Actinomarinicola tropica]|uniref:Cytochrome c maturation protein CcmE n=1 Tax=Actinomarinicola tropica TaxID=2789776 RepID=A0A5Q2RI21_9ACTN|nr:cytochrome c maturation protein CcmE [Actinomarinicola tropica]QGG94532.1 hypothetical protein GH723_05105 [Actinomarinicola tropica]
MDELTRDPDRHDEAGSGDADTLTDLTPRAPRDAGRRRRAPWALLALAVVVVGLVVVVVNGLGDATLFFRTADEAVAQRDSLGDRRFRIEGRVVTDSIVPTATGVDFVISNGEVDVTIAHQGDPPDLFQENIPVVLEGHWARVGETDAPGPSDGVPTDDGWFFASDTFFVRHEEQYVEENPDRTQDYTETGDGAEGAEGETEEPAAP